MPGGHTVEYKAPDTSTELAGAGRKPGMNTTTVPQTQNRTERLRGASIRRHNEKPFPLARTIRHLNLEHPT